LHLKQGRKINKQNSIIMLPSRSEAFELLRNYNSGESLIKHALAVEGVMRHFAELLNEDIEKWGIIGLVHDLDYEMYPEQHCVKTKEILESANWPEDYIRAVLSHGWGICTNIEPVHKMEKVLYTIDELTGLVTASVLVRPTRSILDMEASSVKKKWKIKTFAAGANREVIEKGSLMLEMSIDYIIEQTILGMRKIAFELGLAGNPL
jgi:predicted hydrolase (HD superfamily)